MKIARTEEIGVIALLDASGELVGLVHKDQKSRKNVMYECQEMSFDLIKQAIGGAEVQPL